MIGVGPRQVREGGRGYHEIQTPAPRYRIVDRPTLADALGLADVTQLAAVHAEWLERAQAASEQRQAEWTENLAVGRRAFVEQVAEELEGRVRHRQVERSGDAYVLREDRPPYGGHSTSETEPPSSENP